MTKEIILKIAIEDLVFLNDIVDFEQVWKYSSEVKSDPREFGRIKTNNSIFKFYAYPIEIL